MKQKREEAQKGKKSEMVDIRKSDNFVKIKKFSLLYYHYAYLDTKDYLADQLFVNNKVKVRFGREYEKGSTGLSSVKYERGIICHFWLPCLRWRIKLRLWGRRVMRNL